MAPIGCRQTRPRLRRRTSYPARESGTVYHAFDAQQNVRPLPYNPLAPLCWSLDFNVDPMSSLIAQMEDHTTRQDAIMGYRNVRLHVLDEIVLPDSNLSEVCHEFVRRARLLAGHRALEVRIYGDPAGNA